MTFQFLCLDYKNWTAEDCYISFFVNFVNFIHIKNIYEKIIILSEVQWKAVIQSYNNKKYFYRNQNLFSILFARLNTHLNLEINLKHTVRKKLTKLIIADL